MYQILTKLGKFNTSVLGIPRNTNRFMAEVHIMYFFFCVLRGKFKIDKDILFLIL